MNSAEILQRWPTPIRPTNDRPALLALIGMALVAYFYGSSETLIANAGSGSLYPNETYAVIAAGIFWSPHNIGSAMIFSFCPSMLVEQG